MRPYLPVCVVLAACGCPAAGTPTHSVPGTTPTPEPEPFVLLGLSSSTDEVVEGDGTVLELTATWTGHPGRRSWRQAAGPPLTIVERSPGVAEVDTSDLSIATDVALEFTFEAGIEDPQLASVGITARAKDLVPALGPPGAQIGGTTTDIASFTDASGTAWVVSHVGSRLVTTRVKNGDGWSGSLVLDGLVRDLVLVDVADGRRVAVVALGDGGVATVDLTDPSRPTFLGEATVAYHQEGLSWAEGGGDLLSDQVIDGVRAEVRSLATDGTELWIGDADYGLHRVAVDAVVRPEGPAKGPDGTLAVDASAFTMQYAGETPWGAVESLVLFDGTLFAAQHELGLVLYDPWTLQRVGGYNLYTDASVREDWFLDEDVSQVVQPGYLDPVTGMPDDRQASFEILEVMHGGIEAPTPWADFDRYGKYYYDARGVAVIARAHRTMAYVAYGLGGLVAVDVTGHAEAGRGENPPLEGRYLGYVPAVPVHGPDSEADDDEGGGGGGGGEGGGDSLLSHHGAGKLKESGVNDVVVWDRQVLYADHFAGLVALDSGERPEAWRGAGAPFDNDDPGQGTGALGDHLPSWEFVTSFDMSPHDPTDHESLPQWLYEPPAELVTGEVHGHGVGLELLPHANPLVAGAPDLALASGAGGLVIADVELPNASFSERRWTPGTDEVGAAADGAPGEPIALGHTDGVAAIGDYLYVGDGPHGFGAWRVTDAQHRPIPDVHLVANTVQDEYPVQVGDGSTDYPTPHAARIFLRGDEAWVACRSVGMRRVGIGPVERGLGEPRQPWLLTPEPTDFFEHNSDFGKPVGARGQDHAYAVAFDGDLAFVADGPSGLDVWDTTGDPTDVADGAWIAGFGSESGPEGGVRLGDVEGIAIHHAGGRRYLLLAAGPEGVGVVDATDPAAPTLVKLFEPLKMEDDEIGKADGTAVDVKVHGELATFTYDSFGIVSYRLEDLEAPLPEGVDPTEIWDRGGEGEASFDHRPAAVGHFALRDVPGFEEAGGGALGFAVTTVGGRTTLAVAYGEAGLVWLDWTDPAAPVLLGVGQTVGEAQDVAFASGWAWIADHAGGLAAFR